MNRSHTNRRKTIAQFKKQFGGKWLKKWREYVDGLTGEFSRELLQWRDGREQEACANLLGVKLSTYRNWEYGRYEPPAWTMPGLRGAMAKHRASIVIKDAE